MGCGFPASKAREVVAPRFGWLELRVDGGRLNLHPLDLLAGFGQGSLQLLDFIPLGRALNLEETLARFHLRARRRRDPSHAARKVTGGRRRWLTVELRFGRAAPCLNHLDASAN